MYNEIRRERRANAVAAERGYPVRVGVNPDGHATTSRNEQTATPGACSSSDIPPSMRSRNSSAKDRNR